jgi:hypothetical protein
VLELVANQQRLLETEVFKSHQTAERYCADETTSLHSAKPAQAVDGDDSLEAARVQALCDLIKVDAERDLTTVEQTLDAAQEDIRKEHERVLELVAKLETEVSKPHHTAERYCADEATSLPDSQPAQPVDGGDTLGLARVEALCDLIKVDAERMKVDLTTFKQTLDAARDDICKERDRVLELVAIEQEFLENRSKLIFDRGEMALAQAVLAAQQRASTQADRSPLLKRVHALRTFDCQAGQVRGTSEATAPLQVEDTTVTAKIIGRVRRA